jgi:hypothetical protein
MRLTLLTLIVVASGASAQAGSIDMVKSGQDNSRSIEHIRCDTCIKKMEQKAAAAVIELAPGTQKVEIRDVDGVKKVYRTEAWMGGSPVVYVSKAVVQDPPVVADDKSDQTTQETADTPAAVTTSQPAAAEANMIDEKSKTSAVTADIGANTKVAIKAAPFDPSKLQLRLN